MGMLWDCIIDIDAYEIKIHWNWPLITSLGPHTHQIWQNPVSKRTNRLVGMYLTTSQLYPGQEKRTIDDIDARSEVHPGAKFLDNFGYTDRRDFGNYIWKKKKPYEMVLLWWFMLRSVARWVLAKRDVPGGVASFGLCLCETSPVDKGLIYI